MGGMPLLALSVTAFPEELPTEMLGEVLAGADEAVRAAGAILAGGHTIRDDEPKYGLAVVGTVHPDGIWPKAGARPGDALFLTKPLGTGLVLQAQRDGARAGRARSTRRWRRCGRSNREAADALRPFAPNAVTDVTGFGLLGHAYELAQREAACASSSTRRRCRRSPGALELAAAGVRTGGDRRNREYAGPHVESTAGDRSRGARLRPADRRRPAGPLPADRAAVLAAAFAAAGLCSCTGSAASSTGAGVRRLRIERPSPGSRGGRLAARSLQSPRSARSLFVVVTSGAFVRLTASGLGCDNWPRCGTGRSPSRATTRSSSSATASSRSSASR